VKSSFFSSIELREREGERESRREKGGREIKGGYEWSEIKLMITMGLSLFSLQPNLQRTRSITEETIGSCTGPEHSNIAYIHLLHFSYFKVESIMSN
jgi:hypothetical protein